MYESDKEDYYKPIRIGNVFSNNYIEYESNGVLYVQSDTLLLADVFENFRNRFIEICELDSAHFLSATGLALQGYLKRTGIILELLTDLNILLMVEKGIRGGICHAIHRYAEANNKYMKKYDKNKESSYLLYLHANNLYGWAMSQTLPAEGFKCGKMCLNLMKNLLKIMMKIVKKYIFLKELLIIPKIYMICIVIYHFYQKG